MTLTPGDLRLVALRLLVVEGAVTALCLADGLAPDDVLPLLLVVAWVLGPATLVERALDRRGADAATVGLAAGLAAALLTPVALLQASALGAALRTGVLPAQAAASTFGPGDLPGAAPFLVPVLIVVAGASLFMTLERRTASSSRDAFLTLGSLAAAFLLVLPYLVAAALDRAFAPREEPGA